MRRLSGKGARVLREHSPECTSHDTQHRTYWEFDRDLTLDSLGRPNGLTHHWKAYRCVHRTECQAEIVIRADAEQNLIEQCYWNAVLRHE